MSGYRGFKSQAEYENYYSDFSQYKSEIPAMEAYAREAREEQMPKKELVEIAAFLRHETDGAYLLYDGRTEIKKGDTTPSELRIWVPKSQVEYNEDDGTFIMPEWLAKEKGFI